MYIFTEIPIDLKIDLNHDLILYCSHNPMWMLENKFSVFSTWNKYFAALFSHKNYAVIHRSLKVAV